ncbi:MAG: hypothetical protein K2Y27_29755 [Xanthobacteraceae bacterium]|nr:hypothetical protein [Xanthobacteraceae bacterium]
METKLSPERSHDELISWLGYLKSSRTRHVPEDWMALWKLFDHSDGTVRYLAFELALKSDDELLARRHYKSDWAASNNKGYLENWAGSHLLAAAATAENFATIVKRIDPQWQSALWAKFEYALQYAASFEAFLRYSIERELNPPRSRHYPEYHCSPATATLALLQQKTGELTSLADQLFEKPSFGFERYTWPRMELLRAFFSVDPPRAAKYWRALRSANTGIRMSSSDVDALPFEASDGKEVCDLRASLIAAASTDWLLLGVGAHIARHERGAWAVSHIRELLAGATTSGDIARAVTLAGFLDNSPEARHLWNEGDLKQPLIDGWLGIVYAEARERIVAAWNALDWLKAALAADTDERFFSYWNLFVRWSDLRVLPIAARQITNAMPSLSKRRADFIAFNWDAVNGNAQKAKNNYERTLFFTTTGYRLAMMWAN